MDTEYKPFAEYFRSTAALILLGPVMYTLSLRPQGIYVTDEVNRMGISYVTTCVEFSPTYKAIKPHLDFLLFQVAYRALSLTTEERELFQNDPQEFIRKVHDPYEDMTDPRMAATSLLQILVRYREKDVLPKFMAYLQSILVQYNSSPPESRDYLAKEAALVSIAALLRVR